MTQRHYSFEDFLRSMGAEPSRRRNDSSGSGNSSGNSGSNNNGSRSSSTGSAKWSYTSSQLSEKSQRRLKRFLIIFCILLVPIILLAYWWFHPPISYYSPEAWMFVTVFILLPLFCFFRIRSSLHASGSGKLEKSPKKATLFKRLSWLPVAVVAGVILAAIGSSVVFPGNAVRYAAILNTQTSNFSKDIAEVDYSEIPIIDRESATLLGNRVMGSIPEYVSQFEISDLYSQINYRGHPVRVSPLGYADIFKWFGNRANGIPAYVLVDMTTQDAQMVHLKQGIRYSQSEPFGRNIDRYVQLSYPFYLFDQKSFEIDDEGNPWWVCPVQTRTIGLFGGTTISRVVLVNAVTGECRNLKVSECPVWVDRVYPADLLIEQFNWSGAYKKGWLNSWIGQEGVVQTTPGTNGLLGYNYIAKDNDVWVYTGITSAVSDNSIVGFVLINQRTAESHYYEIAGATEASAMRSAEGQVQHLGYQATFPILININSQPTYFMALKDNAGLVKMFAMLDIQRYQYVAIGDTVSTCQANYQALLGIDEPDIPEPTLPEGELLTTTGIITRIATAVIDGNSHYYLTLEGDTHIYDCPLPAILGVLLLDVGDEVLIRYRDNNNATLRPVENLLPLPLQIVLVTQYSQVASPDG